MLRKQGMYSGNRNTTDVGMYGLYTSILKNLSMAATGLQMDNGIVSAIEYTATHKLRIC
jgi:hypothetical protein